MTPAEAFPNTQNKLAGFKNGYGTVLFFKDTDVVKGLQKQFELYADNFPDSVRTIKRNRNSEHLGSIS